MISGYNDNLNEEELHEHFSTPLLRLFEQQDTHPYWLSAPSSSQHCDLQEDTTYFRKAQIDAIHTLKQKDYDSDQGSLFVPLEVNCPQSDDEDCWNCDPTCHQNEQQFSSSPRTMTTGVSAPQAYLESDHQLKLLQFPHPETYLQAEVENLGQNTPTRVSIKLEAEQVGVEERVASFKGKMKKSSKEAIYAKDELSKKILRHLTTYDRKKIRKMTPKSVRKLKARQLDYVRKYFWKEYEIEDEIMQHIQRQSQNTMITLFCSLDVRLSQQRKVIPQREEALDRKKLINGQKDTVIALLSSQLGKRVYMGAFSELWRRVVQSEIVGTGFEDDFYRYLEDIEAAVSRV